MISRRAFAPCVVLSVHRNLREAHAYAICLADDLHWPIRYPHSL
nr:MAG TPA: hypothetical protein [Caudoviricetes sp.]